MNLNLKMLAQKVSYHARCAATDVLCKTGASALLLREQPGARILLYHGIDLVNNTVLNARFLSQKKLYEQLKYCQEHFHILGLNDYFQGNFAAGKMNIAITFDDGYLNNLQLALPVLEELKIPATFFVTAINSTAYPMLWTDFLDLVNLRYRHPVVIQGEMFEYHKKEYVNANKASLKNIAKRRDWAFKDGIYGAFPELCRESWCATYEPYWKVMNEAQIRQLAASRWVSIGSHGYYHEDLGGIPTEDAVKLLRKGQNYLEEVLDQAITSLAYPNGSYTPALVHAARRIGFDHQFIVDYKRAADRQIPEIRTRLTVNPFISLNNQIRAILSGVY